MEDAPPDLANVANEVDIDLEIRTAIEYVEFENLEVIRQFLKSTHSQLCNLYLAQSNDESRSPFSEHAILRRRGDILYELMCQPVIVQFRVNEQLSPHCFRHAVIGSRVGEDKVLLDTITFTVHNITTLPQCSCDEHFPDIIQSENGAVFSVHPTVKIEPFHPLTVHP